MKCVTVRDGLSQDAVAYMNRQCELCERCSCTRWLVIRVYKLRARSGVKE